jgi:CBS domain-containing protein
MLISDVLRTKGNHVTAVQETDTVGTVLKILADRRIGAVVVENRWQKLVGIVSERDLVRVLAQQGAGAFGRPVQELMTTPVVTCVPSDRIDAVLGQMTTNRIRHLPVIDDGHLVGIVSIGDLVHHRLDEKELEAAVLLDLARMRV